MAEPQLIKIDQPLKGRITRLPLEDQPQGSVVDSLDVVPRDCKTSRDRLSVRAGYASFGSGPTAGLFTLGSAYDEPGGVQLMGCASGTLYRYTSSAFSSVGSITSSTSRTIHAASFGKQLFIACNDPYKFYDYDAGDTGTPNHTIASWTASTAGTIPPNCRIVSTHMNRMVLLADPDNPHVVNFSATDDPFDWDFTGTTSGTAIEVPIGEAATAGIPHNRECFVVGTKGGMWIFRGNPAAGGAIVEQFEFSVGPINSSAWCKGDNGYTYILTHNGLYRMAAGCGSPAEEVSRSLIPDSLIGLDGTNDKAYLVYDERLRFIHIYIEGTNAQYWLYDVDGGGFWKITTPGSTILAAHRFGPAYSAMASGALVATSGGVKRLDSATALGGSSAAYATLLMNLAPLGQKGLVQKAVAHFSSNSTDSSGTVTLYGGETAALAAALSNDRKSAPITISKLSSNHGTWYPRAGGHSLAVKILQVNTSAHWSLEGFMLQVLPNGIERG
jgi:hypothetical protein